METLCYSTVDSPVGNLALIVSERGLTAIEFHGWTPPSDSRRKISYVHDETRTKPCAHELAAYFRGELREFTVALDLRGTEFQLQCWRALLDIPYGQTRSYAEIARAVGRPTAFRAVGMANHSNPIPIIVPCHRVLAANGTLCGYGGGLDVKRTLLELEGAWPKGQQVLVSCVEVK
jgi:O-6-methylguanine DNA methyltransferase